MGHNLEKRILSAGLILLTLSLNPSLHAINHAARLKSSTSSSNDQSGNRQRYSVRFIEDEKKYTIDNKGNLRQINDDVIEALPKPPKPPIIGTASELQEHYIRLQNEGVIPNLAHLEEQLTEIAEGMTQNPRYLPLNGFEMSVPEANSGMLLFAAGKKVSIAGIDYNVLINAIGIYDGKFIRLQLSMYQMADKAQLTFWQSMKDYERRHKPVNREGSDILQRKFQALGERVYDPRLENLWERMEVGLKSQEITMQDIKPLPVHSR